MATEFSLSVDDFKNPKKVTGINATAILLVRLLLLEPGTFQSHPEAGVGLISKYRFGIDGISSELQSEYQNQIRKYFPQFMGVQVKIKEYEKTLMIFIEIDNIMYGISYDSENSKVNIKYTSLSNL